MDLALHSPAISIKTDNHKSAVIYTKSILLIGIDGAGGQSEVSESVLFTNVSLSQAIEKLQQPNNAPDAVMIHPESVAQDTDRLRQLTCSKSIPLILYTERYDAAVRKLAFDIAADDYVSGPIGMPLL